MVPKAQELREMVIHSMPITRIRNMAITRIRTASDPRIVPYVGLSGRQLKNRLNPKDALIILESLNVLRFALESGVELVSVLVDARHLERFLELLPQLGEGDTPIYYAQREVLSAIAGIDVTRGYLACAKRPHPLGMDELLSLARRIVVLEGLTDVSNVGAIFRSCVALGADGIVLSPECADPLNRRAIRVSMGTVLRLPWTRAERPWPKSSLAVLRERGFRTVALTLGEDASPIDAVAGGLGADERVALVLGSEGWGLSRAVLDACDSKATITMAEGIDSLNVATASALACWEFFAKRR